MSNLLLPGNIPINKPGSLNNTAKVIDEMPPSGVKDNIRSVSNLVCAFPVNENKLSLGLKFCGLAQ